MMLSVIMATLDDEAGLVAALGDLIGAAVDGLVREVIVADGGSRDATLAIADDAGATIVELIGGRGARLAAGCARARADWIFVLPPRPSLIRGWEAAVAAHVQDAEGASARLVPARGFGWRRPPPMALLALRRRYDAVAGFRDVAAPERDLLRRLGRPRPLRIALSGR